MTTDNNKPLYRVAFSRKKGTDEKGQDVLSYPRSIGAVFARKDPTKGGIIELDLIPTELREGVLYLYPVDEREEGAGA